MNHAPDHRDHHLWDQHRAVVETSADGFWMIDLQGRLLDVNQTYIRFSGYSREELLAMRVTDLEARENPAETTAHLSRLLCAGSDLFDTVHRAKDGTLWPVEVSASYWPRDGGRIFVFLRDLKRRKRSEALLRIRQRLVLLAEQGDLDALMQATIDEAELYTGSRIGFFHFVDEDQESLRLQTWSTNTLATMCKASGKGKHYPVSHAGIWVECFHRRQPVIHNDYVGMSGKKGLPEGHAPVTRELTVPILRNDLVVAILGVGNKSSDYTPDDIEIVESLAALAIDLVERNKAEAALHDSERNYRLLMDNSSDWVACYDQSSRILFASEACRNLVGFEPGELIGTIGLDLVHPEDRERIVQAMQRLFAIGVEQAEQYRARCKNGNYIWVETKGRLLRDSWDGVPALVGVTRDISSHKALEEQNLRSSQLASVGELAAGVAHEINNPVTGIINYAQLLLNGTPLKISREEILARIIAEGDRIAGIVKALLHLSRDTSGEFCLVGMDELVGNVLTLVSAQFAKDEIVLSVTIESTLPKLQVNPQQVEQALLNLLHNARYALNEKFRDQSGPKLMDLDVAMSRNVVGDPVCRLMVYDNGTGIPPELLPRVTSPFVTTKPAGVGTGLGLSLCQEIAVRHGGALHIDSEWGRFTRVVLELPLG